MSIYQKRWSSCGTGGTPSRSTPTATNVLSSGVEPSTVGTSWNSVRWNKPSTSYRANLASRFENNNTSSNYVPQRTSRFLSSAVKNAADVTSIGPSVSVRASRFDSSNMPNKEKYRNEARDLINKWSSRERTGVGNTYRSPIQRSTFRSTDALSNSAPSSVSNTTYRTSTSLTPSRTTVPSALRYSAERRSVVSPSPTPSQLHTTPKADRPWRQRMAEASRIRSTLGDDVSEAYTARRAANASSRRSSLSQDESEMSAFSRVPSYSALVQPSSYRSRQSSVESSIFSPTTRFTTSSYVPYSLKSYGIDRSASRSKSPTRDSLPMRSTSHVPKNPSIREDSKERDSDKTSRKKSVRERTARRNSRQNSQQDSSSDEEICRVMRSRSSSQHRRKIRKKSSLDTPSTPIKTTIQSSIYETGPEEMFKSVSSAITCSLAESLHALAVAAESEEFQSCAASPLAPSISRSSSKNGVVKNQIIKSPSIVEVRGLRKSESKSSIKSNDRRSQNEDYSLTFDSSFDEPCESSKLDDESQYSAVAHFKPKRNAPVPGMWKKSGTENEEFISRNKTFSRETQTGEAQIIMKEIRREKGEEKKLKAVEKKMILKTKMEPKKGEVKQKEILKQKSQSKIESKEVGKKSEKIQKVSSKEELKQEPKMNTKSSSKEDSKKEIKPGVPKKKLILTRQKKIIPVDETVAKKESAPKVLSDQKVEISKIFSKRSWNGQKVEKILKMKPVERKRLRCRAARNVKIVVDEHYRRKALSERATVLVDTPIKDLNHSVVKASFREKKVKRKSSPPPIAIVHPVPSSGNDPESRPVSCTSRASEILDEMRFTEAAVEWTRDSGNNDKLDANDEFLILPDKSILEQYINRKRGKIDRYRGVRPSSMCSSRGYESSNCASPCPSTISELCLPSSVMIHEARKRAPNSVEPIQTSTTSLNLNSVPRGFKRNQEDASKVIKPVPFEAPKTLFEKMIQEQATRNRNSTHCLGVQSDSETRDPSPNRRGSQEEGMSTISQQFTAAAAAGNLAHGQVRYAAHLPVRNTDGRMSSTSVDSQQSGGALDMAAKNIDHVIDQARHRHHQHRSKFKEAIDYLDQIFEDLKKECDSDDKNNVENETKLKKKTEKMQPAVAQKTKAVVKSQNIKPVEKEARQKKSISNFPQKSQEQNTETRKGKVAQTESPVEVVIPVRKISSSAENQSPTIAETVILAKKTDKMDFTRRWLQDDLTSLAHLPPANIAPNASYYHDFDEHSLGSCSAEVAAFNTNKEKKNSKAPRKTSETSDAVRVRPFRPQPIYPVADSSAFSSNTLPRVTSTDDAYNTLRSMRSEGGGETDASRPSPSAFQQVSGFNRGGSMRSSLRSLPDHSPIRQHRQRIDDPKDPITSIDQLVAELELNTDQPTSSSEKRRSFPTSFVRPTPHRAQYHQPSGGNEYEKPNRYRAEMKHAPTRGRGGFVGTEQQGAIYSQPVASSSTRHQRSLDEVTNMLNKAVSQFGADRAQINKQTSFGSTHSGNAFETINQEKINPSRVEAMHNMFEKGTAPTAWKIQQPSGTSYGVKESMERSKMSPLQEAQYATLHSYSPSNRNPTQVSYHEYTPQLPMSQPPQRPPGSANSSQGGYYSSNSSGVGSNYLQQGVQQQHATHNGNTRRSTLIEQQSISSRVPSMDDDDDGFYDNIGIYNDDRRFSRGSEHLDYRQLPPSSSSTIVKEPKHNRIGSFLRKIGATNRPPGSAASLMSLNKISNETVMKPAGLMKSNSLSTEPWKRHVLEANSSMPREANNNHHQKTGLGTRLKNSLFGSRKRLEG